MKYIKYFQDDKSFSNDEQNNILDLFIPVKDKGFKVSIVRYGKQIEIFRNISSNNTEDYLYSVSEIQDDLEFAIKYLKEELKLKVIVNTYFYDEDDYNRLIDSKLRSKAYFSFDSIPKSKLIEKMEIHISK